eukprot:scaffold284597_cov36-Tisochrysis_lutea.AAC.1
MGGGAASPVCSVATEPPDVDPAHFERAYRARGSAVVIRNATRFSALAQGFRNATSVEALRSAFGSVHVTVSSANAFSYGRKRMLLKDYLNSMSDIDYNGESKDSSGSIYYWFGEHGEELAPLLKRYPLPKLAISSAEADLLAFTVDSAGGSFDRRSQPPALSFGAAGDGSGVPFHHHNDGFAEVLHGAKRWLFHYGEDPPPHFSPNKTSISWIQETLPKLHSWQVPLDCTIYPGDIIYFPRGVWHATVNVGTTIFISTFL